MSGDRRLNAPPALPPQMTVGQHVRERFKGTVRGFIAWASIAAPVSVALKTKNSDFSIVERVGMGLITWALAVALACTLVCVCLAAAGWWKLHMKLSPYVPVTILLVVAVLGYVLVFNFY